MSSQVDPVSQAEPNRAPVLPEPPRMRRRRSSKAVAGVAGGLADHLGVEVFWVRVAFALLAAFAGLGVVAYGLLWMFVPQESARVPVREQTAKERQQAVGLVALGLGLAVVAGLLQGSVGGWLAGPLGVVLVGAAVVWREADEAQRRRWRDGARTGWLGVVLGEGGRNALVRVLAGAVLVTTGLVIFLVNTPSLNQLQFVLLAVFATLVGVAVLTVPWWVRLSRDLSEERRARIRTEERAEIAAHLHDSVLQTLALIQKQAESAREVRRLARGQERELRNWLYGPSGYGKGNQVSADAPADLAGATDQARTTLAAAVATACGEVEDIFAIRVQQVVVGDCPLDDQLVALVQAAREAVVNAAKHAGVAEVSVYAEVEPERVEVFVRDRGKGFDPNAVSADRHGLADSIQGRMERHGGDVRLRTAPGEGTEVQLGMPRRSTKEARA